MSPTVFPLYAFSGRRRLLAGWGLSPTNDPATVIQVYRVEPSRHDIAIAIAAHEGRPSDAIWHAIAATMDGEAP